MLLLLYFLFFFFFNDTATTEIYTLSLHDALPILCADHAVTSLVQLSLVPAFRRGHGALYDALAAGRIDEEAFAQLLTGTLPQLIDGEQGREWAGGHDRIDYGLLERALAGVPAGQAAAVREACARWTRLRFAIDATPYPRPDAGCSPARGHLRTAWTALADVERTTAGTRTAQTIRQIRNLLRRLHAAGADGAGAPLVILDAGYSAAALTCALRGQRVHLLIRLASDQVFYREPVTWPGKAGCPVRHGIPVACADSRQDSNPEPDETLTLPDTPQYGTVEVAAWHQVHPLIHGDRGYFAGWQGELPVLPGTVLRVTVEHLPDGRKPHKTMWLWHAGPAPLSPDELWRAYLARFDEEHTFKFLKGVLGLTAAKVRTPGQADRWVRLVMAAFAQLLLARPLAADLRRPWETRPDPARPLSPGRVRRGFTNIRPHLGTPAHVAKPARPGPGRPKGSTSGPARRYPVPAKTGNPGKNDPPNRRSRVKT